MSTTSLLAGRKHVELERLGVVGLLEVQRALVRLDVAEALNFQVEAPCQRRVEVTDDLGLRLTRPAVRAVTVVVVLRVQAPVVLLHLLVEVYGNGRAIAVLRDGTGSLHCSNLDLAVVAVGAAEGVHRPPTFTGPLGGHLTEGPTIELDNYGLLRLVARPVHRVIGVVPATLVAYGPHAQHDAVEHAALAATVGSHQADDPGGGLTEVDGEVVEPLVAVLQLDLLDLHG